MMFVDFLDELEDWGAMLRYVFIWPRGVVKLDHFPIRRVSLLRIVVLISLKGYKSYKKSLIWKESSLFARNSFLCAAEICSILKVIIISVCGDS